MFFKDFYALALNAARGVDSVRSGKRESQIWALRYALDALISNEEMGVARSLFQRAASERVQGQICMVALEEIGRKVGRTAQVEIVRALCNAVARGLSFNDLKKLQIIEERDGEFRSFDYLNLDPDLIHDAVTRLYDSGNDVAAATIEDGLNRFYEIVQPDEDEELEEALVAAATAG